MHPDDRDRVLSNTLEAFAQAVAIGAGYIETDVRCTRDGVAVLLHDESFLPQGDKRPRMIAQTDFAELAEIRLHNGATIPSLEDALLAFPATRFNIDLKSADAVDPVVDVVLRTQSSSRVLVTSFSGRRRRRALRALPNAYSGAGRSDVVSVAALTLLRQRGALRSIGRRIQALQLPDTPLVHRVFNAKRRALLHEAQIEVHVWTVNDPERMRELLSQGVDGIVTDRTDLAFDVISSLQQTD